MDIIKKNNGSEAADNSSTQSAASNEAAIQEFYQQSLHIAVISKSLGWEGLIGPVADPQKDGLYTFDFFHRESETLFKCMDEFNAEEYLRYFNHPAQPTIILDATGVAHRIRDCGCGCEYMEVTDKNLAETIHEHPCTFIYHGGDLWEFCACVEGEWRWSPVTPALLQPCAYEAIDDWTYERDAEED